MSRLPRISPDDLRDLAADERVERMWARLAPELPVQPSVASVASTSRPRLGTWLIAASLSTFAVGLAVGHLSANRSSESELRATSLPAPTSLDVLAAGSEPRSYVLAGGTRVSLEPEALVEVVEHDDGSASLRLMRGVASFDTSTASGPLSILAGDARVSAPAGSSLSVRRNDRDLDLRVSGGSVEVVTPEGRRLVTLRDGELRVPIVSAVSFRGHAREPEPDLGPSPWDSPRTDDALRERMRAEARSPSPRDATASADDAPAEAPLVAAPPSWLQRYARYEFDDAYRMLESSGGLASAIDGAQRASDLMALADIARTKSQTQQALRALDRVVSEFPSDPNATVAAMTLGRMYESMGNRELAARYFAHAGKSAIFQEDVLCRELRARSGESPPSSALLSQARSFLAKFPDGSCRELAESIVADGAEPAGEPENEEHKPGAQPPGAQPPGAQPPGAQPPSAPAPGPGDSVPSQAPPSASAPPSGD